MGHIGWLLVFSVFVLQDGVRVHDVGTYTCVGADAADLSSSLQLQGRARLPSSCCFISFSEINLTLINVIPLVPIVCL